MFKFRMIESPSCAFCGTDRETVKHLLWDCPRTREVWDYVNSICRRAYNVEYVTYNTVVLGSENPIYVLETLIVMILKIILKKDRTASIDSNVIDNLIVHQYRIENKMKSKRQENFIKRWRNLRENSNLFGHE